MGAGGTRVYGLVNGVVVNDSESGGEVEVDDGDFGSPGGVEDSPATAVDNAKRTRRSCNEGIRISARIGF